MSHNQLTILSLTSKYERDLIFHNIATKIKKRSRTISIGVWNIDFKDVNYPVDIKENYVFFMITAYKKFGIDILILFNSSIQYGAHWYGYNAWKMGNVIILWNQNIIIRPKYIENDKIILINEIKAVISCKNVVHIDLLSQEEKNIIYLKKPRQFLIGLYSNNIFQYTNNLKSRINVISEKGDMFFIGKFLNKVNYIVTPYNLNTIAMINVFKKVECTLGPKLVRLKSKNVIKDVKRILNGEEPKSFPTVKKSLNWNALRGDFGTMSYLMGNILVNQLSPVFKKWNGIWSCFRKEPFLGKTIPDTVKFSYKVLLGDNKDKKYYHIDIPIGVDTDTFPKETSYQLFDKELNDGKDFKMDKEFDIRMKLLMSKIRVKTYSEAANFDMYQLKDITKAIKSWFTNCGSKAILGDIKYRKKINNLLRMIIDLLNKYCMEQCMVTFFLLKDRKLESASDTRMIAIAPTLVKVFEVLTYNEVFNNCEEIIGKDYDIWKYQYGARSNSSTTKAMVELRDKMEEKSADGVITLDISKGYESVDYFKLIEAVKLFTGLKLRLRFLLLSWITIVHNLNIYISGDIIKKTKGIPMGLMFSPLMFIIYVNFLLRQVNKEDLIMYIDDIALVLFTKREANSYNADRARDPIIEINEIINALKVGDLLINFKKAKLITSSDILINEVKKQFPFIKAGDSLKYLGREIFIKGELLLPCDIDISSGIFELIRQIPRWSPLVIRLSVFNGGLEGKSRFQAMMWEVSIDCRKKLIDRAAIFYGSSFENLSIYQILLVLGNYFRLGFNAYVLKNWYRSSPNNQVPQDIVNKRIKVIKESLLLGVDLIDHKTDTLFEGWFKYSDINTFWVEDYFICWKKFSKYIWNKFKYMILFDYWDEINNGKLDQEIKGFAWNKVFCWLIGVDYDKGEKIMFFSIIKRFAFLLDLTFGTFKNNILLDLIYLLNEQIEYLFDDIYNNRRIRQIQILEPFNIQYDKNNMISAFLSKIALLEAINKDGYAKIINSKKWIFMLKKLGGFGLLIFDSFVKVNNYMGEELEKCRKINREFVDGLNVVRQKVVKWLLVFDSIYKDNNIEFQNRKNIISYVKVMFALYNNELDKQMNILEVVNFQLEDDDKFAIDLNIEYNYIKYMENTGFSQ